MPSSQRIEFIDLAKGVCILLVVFMHLVPDLGEENPLLDNLRMPFYYFLSGMFFKSYGNSKNFLIKKTDRLLVPFIAWYLLSYLIYYVRVMLLGHPDRVFRITDLFFESDFYNGSIWFLLSLFWCNIIYYGIEKTSSKEMVRFIVVLCVATIGGFWSYLEIHNFLYLGTSFTVLPFFYAGRQLTVLQILRNERNIKRDILLICICALAAYFTLLFPDERNFYEFYLNILHSGNYLFIYIGALSLILITLTACKYIKRLPFISYIGRFSIIVLVTHRLSGNILKKSVEQFSGLGMDSLWGELSLFSLVLLLMLVTIPICRRFLPYICAQKSFIEERVIKKEKSTVVHADS